MGRMQTVSASADAKRRHPTPDTRSLNPETPPRAKISRRGLLRGAGIVATSAGLLDAAGTRRPVQAQEPQSHPAMRTPGHSSAPEVGGMSTPATPSLGVIALNRMAFGPRPGDLDTFQALGASDDERLQTYVDQQLDPASIDDSACDALIAAQGFETLDKSQSQLWADHIESEMAQEWQYRRLPVWETERATFLRALHSERQLTEVLADFWHNHFNVYGWDNRIQSMFVHYDRDVIRRHMLGNFRQMLGAVARSPAMLYYLDNQTNSGGNPNENYARELFELHGLGAENYFGVRPVDDPSLFDAEGNRLGYVDSDVYGATTCFTGWRIDEETGLFAFDASVHFPYQKFVLGEYIPENLGEEDGNIVLDLIADHPGTARYIARKLCRRFVGDAPPESLVQRVADLFHQQREAPDQLKQVVRAILLSDEFRTTWGQKIKRPFEFACGVLRATGAAFDPRNDFFFWIYNPLGQSLFGWHPPDGYPDVREAWTGTMPILQRWRFVNSVLEWKIGGEGEDSDVRRIAVDGVTPAGVTTPEAIVDFWSERLLGYTLPDGERQEVVEFMAHGRSTDMELPADQIDERLRYMVGLILMAPSFQWR